MTDSVTAADGVQRALNRLAALGLRSTGADRCALFVRDVDGRARLLPAAAASRVGEPVEMWQQFRSMEPLDLEGHPKLLSLWRTPRPVTLDDAASSPLIPDAWKRLWKSRSLAFAAIRAGGEIYGVLAVDYVSRAHAFSKTEARLLDAIANGAGIALRTARLVEQLQRAVDVERRLSECIKAVQSGRSITEVLDLIAELFTLLLPGSYSSINLLSPDLASFRPVAWRAPAEPQVEILLADLPLADVALVRARWEQDPRAPVLVADAGKRAGWDGVVPAGVDAGMLLPLWDGNGILGFAAVGRPGDAYTNDEVRVAQKFADQAAIAVAQARLADTLQARLRLIESLHSLSDSVVRTSDLKALLSALNQGICHEFGIECLRVAFADTALATLLRVRMPSNAELLLIKSWRSNGTSIPRDRAGEVPVPIPMAGRIAGVLWIHSTTALDATALDIVEAIAAGLGEVAYKAKLRRTAERRALELAVAAERERIARDLHDTVGQTFYGIGLKLQDALAEVEDRDLGRRLEELRLLTARAVADVRSAVYALSFLHVRARGFVPSLRGLTRQFERTTGITTELRLEGDASRLPDEAQSALYRVAHEALVNVERHARATGVVIVLASKDRQVELTILDDGVGLDNRQARDWQSAAHFGMRTMAKAVEEVGGRFEVQTAHPRGLVIRASVPVRKAARNGARRVRRSGGQA